MSYLEVETKQGAFIIDTDRITGIGEAVGFSYLRDTEDNPSFIVVLFVSGDHVDIVLNTQEQAKRLVEEVRKIIVQRKVRQPTKPIIVAKE